MSGGILDRFGPPPTRNARYVCTICRDRGLVFAVKRDRRSSQAPYTFRCRCKVGGYQRRSYPEWKNEHEAEFEILR